VGIAWGNQLSLTMLRAVSAVFALAAARAAEPFTHSWDTVSDLMGMHGSYNINTRPTQAAIEFAATHYAHITIGASCAPSQTYSMEADVLGVAAKIKAANPAAVVGMYWRADFALELAQCSDFKDEWNAHALAYALKMDNGTAAMNGKFYFIDHTNAAAKAFFVRAAMNATRALLPSGAPIIDYIYVDGDPGVHSPFPGVSQTRAEAQDAGYYTTFAMLQAAIDAEGRGQQVILNGLDDADSAQTHTASGAAGSMFDHWTILQFLNSTDGTFNLAAMTAAIELASGASLANVTLKIKGWPGPIVAQKDKYPPNVPTPTTPSELQQVAGERFNSELALFLLVASEKDFWVYSWFWGFSDYIPVDVATDPKSTVPVGFYPDADCALGAPKGPARKTGAATYERAFEHAAVFVDLVNRTASHVDFDSCTHKKHR